MSNLTFRPWTDLVKLHPDVESGALTEAVFAIDLGAIATNDPNIPAVYRDAEAFFRATYLTTDLRKLLEEVLACLSGKPGYNRVLKLRTPFGGGKSHTLATLLHAARQRAALDVLPEAAGFANPGPVAVAVLDGEKFDAREGKLMPDGRTIRTMWGWLAWQIDPERAYPIVAGHDQDRVAPGGDVIIRLLTEGAGGRPVLFLLDEVLKYMERAAAVSVQDSTLQRQAKDFFQNLTVEVANSRQAALVYSLTWSARESLGNVGLLNELDKLANRVDQLREPVTGDEVLMILQRRLLGGAPDAGAANEMADAYASVVTNMRRAHADSASDRQQAEEEGLLLRDRLRAAYPFHPALIDLMRERWTALDNFQRTRGALRFLASCLYSLKRNGNARPLLGVADIPLIDVDVRLKMLKELGAQNDYDAVITADIDGPNARARKIDDRLGRETPALAGVRPATRLATAILLYSFGGLRREAGTETETLPPGVTESELLAACVGPDFDNITATAVLGELRNACLYLHYDGARYCFKKDPNVTKLIEDAEQEVSREETQNKSQGPVRARIKEILERNLGGQAGALVWPAKSQDIPEQEPRFLVAYLPLEFAGENETERERQAKDLMGRYGDRPRRYRNGLGLAIPDRKQIEALRRAVRYLLATERVEVKRKQLRLTGEQFDQLKERQRTEVAATESALRELYSVIWLPRMESGELCLEKIDKGGRPLQATGVHQRIMELLTSGAPKLHSSTTPRKIIDRLRLGETLGEGAPPRLGLRVADVVEAFYRDLEPPRLDSAQAIQKAIARGVAEGTLAYTSGAAPTLGADGKYQLNRDRVIFSRLVADDEIDLDSGFILLPVAVPAPPAPSEPTFVPGTPVPLPVREMPTPAQPGVDKPTVQPPIVGKQLVLLTFSATRTKLFKAFPALANLADKADSGEITITVTANAAAGFDQAWLRNAVDEPLDEADVKRKE